MCCGRSEDVGGIPRPEVAICGVTGGLASYERRRGKRLKPAAAHEPFRAQASSVEPWVNWPGSKVLHRPERSASCFSRRAHAESMPTKSETSASCTKTVQLKQST